MAAQSVTLFLPEKLAHELEGASEEYLEDIVASGLRAIRVDRALLRYADGGMSFGAAAAMAGISQSGLSRHAYARGMEPLFDSAMIAEELG